MAQARGYKKKVLFIEESTFNTTPTVNPGDMINMPFNSFSLGSTQNLISPETITGNRNPVAPAHGNISVEGEVVVPVEVEGIGYWLKLLCGDPNTTGAGPYAHEYKVQDNLPSASLESGYPDPAHYMIFSGCKAESFSMNIGGDQELTASINLMGGKEVIQVTSLDSAPSELSTFKRFNNFQATIREGGITVGSIRTVEFEIRNNLDRIFTIGSGGFTGSLPEGIVEISGRIEALFDSTTLYDKAINGTESSIEITLTNGAYSLVFDFPEVIYERNPLTQEGPSGVFVDLPFRAFYDNNVDTSAYVITLTNDVADYS